MTNGWHAVIQSLILTVQLNHQTILCIVIGNNRITIITIMFQLAQDRIGNFTAVAHCHFTADRCDQFFSCLQLFKQNGTVFFQLLCNQLLGFAFPSCLLKNCNELILTGTVL